MQYKVIFERVDPLLNIEDKSKNNLWILLFTLSQEVEEYAKEGWKPQGGISISLDKYGDQIVAQAMVKED